MRNGARIRVGLALSLILAMAMTGCSHAGKPAESAVSRPAAPAGLELSSPEAAVRSYLAWTAYAYRIGNSDVATQTMGPREEVRVNSYVEMNRERSRVIDQRLVAIGFGQPSGEGTTVVLPAHETWEYRYLSITDEKPLSAMYTATYDTTYTVVSTTPEKWVVDHVDAKPLGEVK
jgi:hypothetical protein